MLAHWYGLLFLSGAVEPPVVPTATKENDVDFAPQRKKRIVKIAWNGIDYTLEEHELPGFLESIKAQLKDKIVERAQTKRTKKPAPVVKVVEATGDKQDIVERLVSINQLIRSEWADAVANYVEYQRRLEEDREEEDIEFLLMAA